MNVKLGISGAGRIGRLALRLARGTEGVEVVAIVTTSDPKSLAHMVKYDSVHGRYPGEVTWENDAVLLDGRPVRVVAASLDPADLPWGDLSVDAVLEATGRSTSLERARRHLLAGGQRVVISAPSESPQIPTVVMGVNDDRFDDEQAIVSAGSCTTNCLAPLAKVLHERFGIEQGLMTTVHAYTRDQELLDGRHRDLRRGRSCGLSAVPTSTGAGSTLGLVLPELAGRIAGMAVRVPIPDGSFLDLSVQLRDRPTAADINEALYLAAAVDGAGILEFSDEPLVSVDIIGNSHSCVVDSEYTQVLDHGLARVCAWYDNEWAYTQRCLELARLLTRRQQDRATTTVAPSLPARLNGNGQRHAALRRGPGDVGSPDTEATW